MKVGYCTNVHAGTSLDAVNQNLLTHAVQVREQLLESDSDQSQPLPVGPVSYTHLTLPTKA